MAKWVPKMIQDKMSLKLTTCGFSGTVNGCSDFLVMIGLSALNPYSVSKRVHISLVSDFSFILKVV